MQEYYQNNEVKLKSWKIQKIVNQLNKLKQFLNLK